MLCPVHQLWDKFFKNLEIGEAPWADISPCKLRSVMRECLQRLRVPEALRYGTHDFRRGHAKDLYDSGVSLDHIRLVGHWARVGSMKPYLDIAGLEQDVVLEVALQSDEDEEWID